MSCNDSMFISENWTRGICEYHVPSGKTANLTNLGENDGVGVAFQVFPSPGSYFDRSKTDKLYLSNFEAVKMPAGTQFMDQSWQKKAEKAYECALWACMHAIETWQVNSNQTQTARYTWDKVDNSSTTPDVRDHNITFVDIPKYMNVPTNANFTFLGWPAMAMNAYFDTLFDGNITVMNSIQLGSSDVVQALWNATADLDTWMQIVASSMTNIVRSFDLAPEQPSFDGIAYQLGYDVRWIWIILPATIVGASLLLLVVVIVRTTRSDTHPWKGSPLALLLMSVDHNMAARAHGQMERYDGIEKAIGKERVTLGRDANGLWRLKQA